MFFYLLLTRDVALYVPRGREGVLSAVCSLFREPGREKIACVAGFPGGLYSPSHLPGEREKKGDSPEVKFIRRKLIATLDNPNETVRRRCRLPETAGLPARARPAIRRVPRVRLLRLHAARQTTW